MRDCGFRWGLYVVGRVGMADRWEGLMLMLALEGILPFFKRERGVVKGGLSGRWGLKRELRVGREGR